MKTRTASPMQSQEGEHCSIVDAALRLGLDSFTVCALVQRNKLRAKRLPSGEFVIPASELHRIFHAAAARVQSDRKSRPLC